MLVVRQPNPVPGRTYGLRASIAFGYPEEDLVTVFKDKDGKTINRGLGRLKCPPLGAAIVEFYTTPKMEIDAEREMMKAIKESLSEDLGGE